jgi:glutathione S-transferase
VGKLIPERGRERCEVRTWEALADGIMDAGMLVRMERSWAHRPPEQRNPAWIARHLGKVNAALAAMSQGLGEKAWCSGNHFSLADISVGCALGWLEYRFPEIDWRESHPNLARHMDKLSQRPSFADTVPAA